jgi:hypothetical protein
LLELLEAILELRLGNLFVAGLQRESPLSRPILQLDFGMPEVTPLEK